MSAAEILGRFDGFLTSSCNSGGALYFPAMHGSIVRSGIALYGYYPNGSAGRDEAGEKAFKPAMRFSTRVLQINRIKAGAGISYGHTFIAERDMELAVLPVGYSDGYPRMLSNRAEVLIAGRRAPIKGRVCMNLCMVDVTDIPDIAQGTEAVLLGSQGDDCIDADEIASWCGTISYEILCSLGNNNKRRTVGTL